MQPHVVFRGVFKVLGSQVVVRGLDLEVRRGEFLVLVGPSGCGKTTTLRMLAGLERPSFGTVAVGGRVMNDVAPKDRNIALVFQSYALYPHMSVRDNLGFGMRARGESRGRVRERVDEVSRGLGIDGLLDRRPAQLSGGQRQRVALGRALMREPEVFLMDEPLSNLDAALRVQMRAELARLHERLGITTVYVTHDQVEAMTMGDRIVVMRDGVVQQADVPERLYDRPANVFVAEFIGSPKMNMARGRVDVAGVEVLVEWLGRRVPLSGFLAQEARSRAGGEVLVGVRSEDLVWTDGGPEPGAVVLPGVVEVVEPLGSETLLTVAVAGGERVIARARSRSKLRVHDQIELCVDPTHLHLFDTTSEESLRAQEPAV